MDRKRLNLSDIAIGEPLPWDVYGEGNKLLLRRGHIVENTRQIEELMQRGLFVDAGQDDRLARAKREAQVVVRDTPSALRLINLACKRLERLLYNLSNEPDAENKILEIGNALAHACDINTDICLASLLLNQAAADYAARHSIDTALLSLVISRAMKKPPEEIRYIVAAALTMNIGMLRQHDQLQNKEEALSEKETELVKGHPNAGVQLLRQAGIAHPDWLTCVQLHHEDDDGSGYPAGNAAGPISQNAKIVAFSDRYCAAISHRKYRKVLLPGAAIRDVLLPGGKPSDPMLAAYFIKELGTYPPGSFVRLQNGETGVVTRRPGATSTPVVHAFIGPRGAPLSFPIQRDTSKELFAIREMLPNQQVTLRFSMQQLWGNEAAL